MEGLYERSNPDQQKFLFTLLSQKFPSAPNYGRNIEEFVELLSTIWNKNVAASTKTQQPLAESKAWADFINLMVETFRSQNELLGNHPNSHIYSTLQNLVEFEGYYLDSQPCLICNDPEQTWYWVRLDGLQAEKKSTDSTQMTRFTGSYAIQSIILKILDGKKGKMAKQINFYYNNKPVVDIAELRNKWSAWKKAKSCTLTPGRPMLSRDLYIQVKRK